MKLEGFAGAGPNYQGVPQTLKERPEDVERNMAAEALADAALAYFESSRLEDPDKIWDDPEYASDLRAAEIEACRPYGFSNDIAATVRREAETRLKHKVKTEMRH
ncbi:hypothetical protein A3H16_01530 [Candidatus Kaiserbacteria bacterium RIFCSPLOWO2_12_FULL_53_8]|uniref:Uncharacterized protein n=2 Tax=Candidatus Kaiseribacteriota TaxID=1752734 RepID=A0A1F6CW45_9BACT|nr:MAG: hypothetical protein A2851_00185 [Candidatus Kaiserbacteria bacterium RIFCSPHIGHO2_01_FULL_53_29]OGG91090.1 MAG: hypothetical protein A3H16_01530 [Candidatus Kaiserbacteria bacterium RIFCSPLOWO2_12_FULL_53_8]